MKDFKKLKIWAVRLRKRGYSYNEIRQRVPVAKSTLSLWLKELPLSIEHRQRLYTKNVLLLARGPNSQKERRKREVENIIRLARNEISLPLSQETFRLMGAALYWAEGSKTKKFEFTNSDPSFIVFMIRWVEKIFGVPRKILRARLNMYPQQNEEQLKKFWSELTGVPLENFGKSFIKPPNKGHKKNNLYYGTIKILVPKGTDTRHRVFGWIEATLKDVEPKIKLATRRWVSLKETPRPINIAPHNSIGRVSAS